MARRWPTPRQLCSSPMASPPTGSRRWLLPTPQRCAPAGHTGGAACCAAAVWPGCQPLPNYLLSPPSPLQAQGLKMVVVGAGEIDYDTLKELSSGPSFTFGAWGAVFCWFSPWPPPAPPPPPTPTSCAPPLPPPSQLQPGLLPAAAAGRPGVRGRVPRAGLNDDAAGGRCRRSNRVWLSAFQAAPAGRAGIQQAGRLAHLLYGPSSTSTEPPQPTRFHDLVQGVPQR